MISAVMGNEMAVRGGALGHFGDARRAAIGNTLVERVVETGSLVIRKLGGTRAREIAIHRFLYDGHRRAAFGPMEHGILLFQHPVEPVGFRGFCGTGDGVDEALAAAPGGLGLETVDHGPEPDRVRDFDDGQAARQVIQAESPVGDG